MTPKDETALCEILAAADKPIRISGGDTRNDFMGEGDTLSTRELNGIIE